MMIMVGCGEGYLQVVVGAGEDGDLQMLNDAGLYGVDASGRVRLRADCDHHLELVRPSLAALT